MQNVTQMVEHHRQQNDILADIQKQAQLVSDMAWSVTIQQSGKQQQELLQALKQQNENLQKLFKAI